MENRKKELEIEIAQEQIKRPILTREQIHFGLTKFRKLDLSTQEGRKRLIDGFVNAIYLFDDYAIITCNYKDGEERIAVVVQVRFARMVQKTPTSAPFASSACSVVIMPWSGAEAHRKWFFA